MSVNFAKSNVLVTNSHSLVTKNPSLVTNHRLFVIWEASERHLNAIREASGRHLGGIWEGSERLGVPRGSQGDLSHASS